MSRNDFIEDLKAVSINYLEYESAKYTLIAILGLRAFTIETQK